MTSVIIMGAMILLVMLVLWFRDTPPAFEPYENEKVEDFEYQRPPGQGEAR